MKVRKHSGDQSCPCCGAEAENTFHLFQCQNEEIQKTYEDEVDKVNDDPFATTSVAIKNMVLTTLEQILVNDANKILEACNDSLDATSEAFLDFDPA